MYYNRTLSDSFARLLEPEGEFRWLFDFVQNHPELDFLTGKNKSIEWISIYRGLSRLIRIRPTSNPDELIFEADKAFHNLVPTLYGRKQKNADFSSDLINLIASVSTDSQFFKFYDNQKEGFYQNELSRKFGICGKPTDEYVIIDKEAVIGYENQQEKDSYLFPIQEGYQRLLIELSQSNPKRYGKNIGKKSTGNELDFLVLDKQGNIQLIEYKDGKNPSGIYLSPFQIGGYYDLWMAFPEEELKIAIRQMIKQKQKIELINPDWKIPEIREIVPMLIVSEYNYKSKAREKYFEVMDFLRARKGNSFLENIQTYNYTLQDGLKPW